jgi:hypothetical protein
MRTLVPLVLAGVVSVQSPATPTQAPPQIPGTFRSSIDLMPLDVE